MRTGLVFVVNNRLWNCKNPHQGDAKKVLCVCSAGLLRSPTAANVLHQEYGYNTRACGLDVGHALIPIDEVLITWADEIVCMTEGQEKSLIEMTDDVPIVCLSIPDCYGYMNPELVGLIKANYPG